MGIAQKCPARRHSGAIDPTADIRCLNIRRCISSVINRYMRYDNNGGSRNQRHSRCLSDCPSGGVASWLKSLTADLGTWTIKPIMKDEMYGEVASTILLLRGTPTSVKLPEMKYWRTLQFAPPSNKMGAPGMPPFDVSYFAADQKRDL
jgi:hypothetical protein